MNIRPFIQIVVIILVSPFLLGIVNRVKSFFAGRKGPSALQLYYDIFKLFRKGAVYSKTTSWIFLAGPIAGLGACLAILTLIPFAGYPSIFAFSGDFVLLVYLLGLIRFFMVLSALDTGSSFEGMGASREVLFAVFAESALFLALAALSSKTQELSLSGIFANLSIDSWRYMGPILVLVSMSILIVFLAENSRMPVDDPNTHLELTMIHEVMALDHGGFDFAYILYAAALKFWILGTFFVSVFLPMRIGVWGIDFAMFIAGMFLLAGLVGIIESVTARVRLVKVPYLLLVAFSLSILALAFQMK